MGSYPSTAASTEVWSIVKNWREHPPSSYSLKIHNFSLLEKSTTTTAYSDHKYQSRLFSSGGYNWRLIIYPKGNAEDNGSGFISMYVEIDSESLMPPTEVCAELRFFVYNKRENKYLTIQDVEVKRFNALKTVWGLQQVLPCVTFNNPDNGYIFQGGQCEFGVDVIVAPSLTNWEVFSFTEKFPDPKFFWAIKNFSELKENVIKTSKSFSMGGKKWFLKLYPKGHSRVDGKWLSFYLYLDDTDKPKADEKIFVHANLRILNPLGTNHFEYPYPLEIWYTEQNAAWGWAPFLSLPELRYVYLDKEDELNVEVEFKVVSATKYSPII